MKYIQAIVLFLVAIFYFTSHLNATEQAVSNENHVFSCPKTYVEADKIAFAEGAILVNVEEQIIETPAIFSDKNGFYILQVKVDTRHCMWPNWECDGCGYCNNALERCCLVCEHDRAGRKCK